MTEEVRWTPAGKAALAATHGALYRDTPDGELKKQVFAAAKQLAPAWKRGVAKADAEGTAAAALAAKTIVAAKLPKTMRADDAARLLSLIGASGSEHVGPLGELMVRSLGLADVMAVLAKMWSHRTEYANPDWPKSEKRTATYITAIDDDHDHVHDASCSYSKSAFTMYLHRRYQASPKAEQAQMKKGVSAVWTETTPHARPALAYATHDPKRAKQSALELIDAGESPWPYFAWDHLPYVLDDAELALRLLGERNLGVHLIKNLGVAVWPLYEERIGGHVDGRTRAELLGQLSNFYGPRTALIIAEYEDTKECAPIVREYFALYPELLDKIIDEPALKYHREDLEKLRVDSSAPGRPARGRRRS